MQRSPAEFFRSFLLPLVRSGELHVGPAVDAEALALLQREVVIGTAESAEISTARQALAATLWPYPLATPLDAISIELAAGLHNLLFLSRPELDGWRVRDSARERLVQLTADCLRQPPPRSAEELIVRHTLLGGLTRMMRIDVTVDYWSATETFIGQEPPARLLRLPRLRRVHVTRDEVRWLATALSQEQEQLLIELMRQSPLTDLLSPLRARPAFSWAPLVRYLVDPRISRLVCHLYIEQGLGRIGPVLARAFWQLAASPAEDPRQAALALRTAAALVGYLHAALAMDHEAPDELEPHAMDPGASLPVVLHAALGCGVLPPVGQLGDATAAGRIEAWLREVEQRAGAHAGRLTQELQAALDRGEALQGGARSPAVAQRE